MSVHPRPHADCTLDVTVDCTLFSRASWLSAVVAQENRVELEKLDVSSEHTYQAKDSVEPDPQLPPTVHPNPDITPNEVKKFDDNCPAMSELKLRIGAQVMLD